MLNWLEIMRGFWFCAPFCWIIFSPATLKLVDPCFEKGYFYWELKEW